MSTVFYVCSIYMWRAPLKPWE